MRFFSKTLWLTSAAFFAMASGTLAQDNNVNTPYNDFLAKYVSQVGDITLVAYDKVTDEDEAVLETYIETLSAIDVEALSDEEELVYWFNLYNAETINVILDHYPVTSIRKIGFMGPWKKKRLTVGGEKLSLNNIEHDIVREDYDEPRIHFAFNCASIGCPNLKTTAWVVETLEADLDQAAKDYIASSRGIQISDDGKVTGSSLFKWYKKDFGQNDREVALYLSQFATGETKAVLEGLEKFDDFEYDWDLNIQR